MSSKLVRAQKHLPAPPPDLDGGAGGRRYFDKDGSGRVTLVQLEAGLQTLGSLRGTPSSVHDVQ